MSDIAERYRRLAGTFEERIAAVPADRWEDPSPCEDWTARDVVRHVVDTQALFLGPSATRSAVPACAARG